MGELRRYAAANARVRGLLATLLGRSGLETLYSYPSRQAILDVLLRTPYGASMPGEPASDAVVLGRLVDVGRTVLGMLDGPEAGFVRDYLLHHEVRNLKIIIRALDRHLPWEQIAPQVLALGDIATINPQVLLGARDLGAFIEQLAGTPYHQPLARAWRRLDEAGPFVLEAALDMDYYARLWAATGVLQASDTLWARRLLGIVFDILNLGWIIRYRDAFGLPFEDLLSYTLPEGRWITSDVRRALCADADRPWESALAGTPYAVFSPAATAHRSDLVFAGLWRLLGGEIQRALSAYPFHVGVPLGFLLAQEIEIRDLQVLLAAKSIGVATEEALECVATVRH